MLQDVRSGLEGIVVAESTICAIDGQAGTLCYRGIDIGDLAQQSTYEETVYLLWYGELPTAEQLEAFRARLSAERTVDETVWQILVSLPGRPPPMEALRTAVSALSCSDPDVGDYGREANLNKALRLTTRLPIIVAYYQRHLDGLERVEPDPALGHAANLLYMLRGERPSPLEERAMDLSLVLMADHEFNASTFAARVTASTLSDMYSAITTAIGTLKGPLHGGANQRAMEMLLEIDGLDQVEPYIGAALAAKKRIMGFGHRVYRDKADPRSAYLRAMLKELCEQRGDCYYHDLAKKVADTVEAMKGLYPNVDFYTAPLLHLLGIPLDLFTPIFAVSRIAGWTSHVMEQYEHNRLMRPLSAYVGPGQRGYIPLEDRSNGYKIIR
ncbi:MAG: citrate synthase [Anaerolineae bacterium]|nr:citrate synthase [Anaerolineae bacterium]